jgi:hypothetical protein
MIMRNIDLDLIKPTVVYSVADTASMLGISSAVVYRLINTHHLVAFKHDHGRDWYILGQDILDYIAEQKEVSKKSWKK